MTTKSYIKHLVDCRCILPQFKKLDPPINHKFITFSEIEGDTGNVIKSYAQCPNCGVIHKIIEIGKSEIINKESMLSLQTKEDIKTILPDWLSKILERHDCELVTWQEAKFVYENQKWGHPIILAKERDGDTIIGKYLLIMGNNLHKIEGFERWDGIIEL